MTATPPKVPQPIIRLFDSFTHGGMSRRDFLDRLTALAGGTAAAMALLPVLENNYAHAATIAEDDPRIVAEMVDVAPGTGLRGYRVRPANASGPLPAVLVIHENRGLNPHIRDVTRRVAAEGFLALGLDYLSPLGGTPEDADKAREMIGTLTPEAALASSRAAVAALAADPGSTGAVGAIGFCWGGGQVGALAVAEPSLRAGVVYYGRPPAPDRVPDITAPLLLHYAGLDERINADVPAFEAALKAAGKAYELFMYEGANHAFNNDTNAARYDAAAAALAWERSMAFLRKYLATTT